jgi:hypothetical protein
MGYLHITNLYKDQRILAFKRLYAMEKIHGTSTHIAYTPPVELEVYNSENSTPVLSPPRLSFYSGGVTHSRFVSLFDVPALTAKLQENFPSGVTIYGEAYGGSVLVPFIYLLSPTLLVMT